MADPPRPSAADAVHNFISELRAAFERAGPPTYARLEELSERLHDPNPEAGPRVLVLAHSTTHDTLTGKHVRLPPWPWVSSLIHVLRVAAVENGLDPETIGTTTEWHTKYLKARSAVRQAARREPPLAAPTPPPAIPAAMSSPGATARDRLGQADRRLPTVEELLGHIESDRRATAAAAPFLPAGPGVWLRTHAYRSRITTAWPSDGRDRVGAPASSQSVAPDVAAERPGTVPPPEPPLVWRRYVEAYGRTGMRLLRLAETDERGTAGGVAAYRLATLVACEHRPVEALYWLRRAGRAGHHIARRLAADWNPGGDGEPPHYWRPAEAAYEIGLHYEAAGRPFSAAVFFDGAAGAGHPEAAYRAGLHRMQLGRHWDAMLMFNRAAGAGHRPARRERDGLLLALLGRGYPSSPGRTWLSGKASWSYPVSRRPSRCD